MPVKDARQELKDTTSQLLKTWLPRLTDPEYLANTSLGKALAGFAVASNPGVALAAPLLAKTLGNKQVGELMDAYDMATKGMPLAGQADDALRLLAKTGPGLAIVPPMQRYYGRMKPRGVPASLSEIWHSALAEVMDKKFLEPGDPTDLVPLREIQEFVKNKLPGMGVPKNEMNHFDIGTFIDDEIRTRAGSISPDPMAVIEAWEKNEKVPPIKVSRQDLADYIDKRIPALDLQPEGQGYSAYAMDHEMKKGVQHTAGEYSTLNRNTTGYQNYRIMNPSSTNAAPKKEGLTIGPDGKVSIDFATNNDNIPSESALRLNPDPRIKRHWGDNTGEIGHIRVTGAGSDYDPKHGLVVEEIQSDPGKSENWPLGRFADIALPAIRKLAQEGGLDKFTVSPSGAHINRYKGWKVTKLVPKDEALDKLGPNPLNHLYDLEELKDNLPKEFVDKYLTPVKNANKEWNTVGQAFADYKEAAYKKAGVPEFIDEYTAPAGMSPQKIKERQDAHYSGRYAVDQSLYAKDKTFLKLVRDRQAAFDEYRRLQSEGNRAYADTYRHQVKDFVGTKQNNFDGYVNVYDKFAPNKMKQMAKQTGEEVNVVNDIRTKPIEASVTHPLKKTIDDLKYKVFDEGYTIDSLIQDTNFKQLEPRTQDALKHYHDTKTKAIKTLDALNEEKKRILGPSPEPEDFGNMADWRAAKNKYSADMAELDFDLNSPTSKLYNDWIAAEEDFTNADLAMFAITAKLQPVKKQQPGVSIKQLADSYKPSHKPNETPVQPNFNEIFEYKINPDLRVTFPFWGK